MRKLLLAAAAAISLATTGMASAAEDCIGIRAYRPDLPDKWVVVQLFNVEESAIKGCNGKLPNGSVNKIETLAAGKPEQTIAVHVGFHGRDGGWFSVPKEVADGLRFVTNETTGIHEGWSAERNDRDADGRIIVHLVKVR